MKNMDRRKILKIGSVAMSASLIPGTTVNTQITNPIKSLKSL